VRSFLCFRGKSLLQIATQTLGEEYTDIWQYSVFRRAVPPSRLTRAALVLLPTLPAYLLARLDEIYPDYGQPSQFRKTLKTLPGIFEVLAELNLATFYISGTYYDLVKRFLGIRKVRKPFCGLPNLGSSYS
jgi:peroxin-10